MRLALLLALPLLVSTPAVPAAYTVEPVYLCTVQWKGFDPKSGLWGLRAWCGESEEFALVALRRLEHDYRYDTAFFGCRAGICPDGAPPELWKSLPAEVMTDDSAVVVGSKIRCQIVQLLAVTARCESGPTD